MTKQTTYVVVFDAYALFSHLTHPSLKPFSKKFTTALAIYANRMSQIIKKSLPKYVSLHTYTSQDVDFHMDKVVSRILNSDSKAVIICLDRFLLKEQEESSLYSQKFFRIEICRDQDNRKIPRVSSMTLVQQINTLKKVISSLHTRNIYIIDSSIFTGETIRDVCMLFSKRIKKNSIKKIICFLGIIDKKRDKHFPYISIIKPIYSFYECIEGRDFTPLGGKIMLNNKKKKYFANIPYIYPWSDGSSASFTYSNSFVIMSEQMLKAFYSLLRAYEKEYRDSPITFRELENLKFSKPQSMFGLVKAYKKDSLSEYLTRCLHIIQREKNAYRNVL
jgi:hypothetical protein